MTSRVLHFAVAALLLVGACADRHTPLTPPTDSAGLNSIFRKAISEPVQTAAQKVVSASPTVGTVYIAFSAGELPDVRTVRISNVTSGEIGTTVFAVINGALDPVAVSASVGDTLELLMSKLDGSSLSLRAAVPSKRPPRVIRTDPPKGRTDVALNTRIVVVFSEPMDRSTLDGNSIRLLSGSQPVAGSFVMNGNTPVATEFIPNAPLLSGSTYTVDIARSIRDLSGDELEQSVNFNFVTATATSSSAAQRQIAFVSCYEDGLDECARFGISVVNEDGTDEHRLTEGPADLSLAWSPDGSRIAFSRADRVFVVNSDGSGVRQLVNMNAGGAAWSPDGRRIAFVGESSAGQGIYVINSDGTGLQFVASSRYAMGTAWSPDGSSVAYIGPGELGHALYVLALSGGQPPRRISASVQYPLVWSPDGQKIAFPFDEHVHVINSDGSNEITLAPRIMPGGPPRWSPDGTRIAFPLFDAAGFRARVAIMNADGSNVVALGEGHDPLWSPDGTKLAYVLPSFANGFFVVAADGSNQTVVRTAHWIIQTPVWSPRVGR